ESLTRTLAPRDSNAVGSQRQKHALKQPSSLPSRFAASANGSNLCLVILSLFASRLAALFELPMVRPQEASWVRPGFNTRENLRPFAKIGESLSTQSFLFNSF